MVFTFKEDFFQRISSFLNNFFQHGLSIGPHFLNYQRLQILSQIRISLILLLNLIENCLVICRSTKFVVEFSPVRIDG